MKNVNIATLSQGQLLTFISETHDELSECRPHRLSGHEYKTELCDEILFLAEKLSEAVTHYKENVQ